MGEMSLIKVGVALGVVIVAFATVPFVWKMQSVEKQQQIVAILPETLRPNRVEDVPTQKITVYQSQGHQGEIVFSDQRSAAHNARTRVVDNAKGTTTHLAVQNQEAKSSALLNFSEDNARLQQQAQALHQARMARVIGE